ncbi:helix-turn-helix transcriptional regulator [Streptomyces violaceusniger]|uniref:Helix-turn-helix domain protein n=1 Tax=Streptomyces violaceusniger (strain Tu 4113) TaxID=653045 RepID=G2P0E7_STRV4|nr:helix-turn-helix transcriptional regulator [Streptomyces violaceusniger]AEM85945.1 helix-turn-helix domain protein [Streptomyces violaceusniger Tu 4113]
MRMQVPAAPPPGSARDNGARSQDNPLGEFLRTTRSRLMPADVGLSTGRRTRRVEGLRRQEVSVLSGVSADHYSRLEQGRERNPSPQTVEALGRALQLAPDARAHLFRLAGLNPSLRSDCARERVPPPLLQLLEASHQAAAYVLSPCLDILAANAPAQALLSPFTDGAECAGGALNLTRILFTHPRAKTYFAQWPLAVTVSLLALRRNALWLPDDTEIEDLIAELSPQMADFTGHCAGDTATALDRAYGTVVHPAAGRIELTYRVVSAPAAPGQQLLIGTPAPGGRSAQALTYLTAMGPQHP